MAYTVLSSIVMAYMDAVVAYIGMAFYSYGPHSYGPHECGLFSHGHGVHRHGFYSLTLDMA